MNISSYFANRWLSHERGNSFVTIHNDQILAQIHTKCWPVNQVDRLPAKLSSAVCHSQHVTTIVPKLTMSHIMEALSNILHVGSCQTLLSWRNFPEGLAPLFVRVSFYLFRSRWTLKWEAQLPETQSSADSEHSRPHTQPHCVADTELSANHLVLEVAHCSVQEQLHIISPFNWFSKSIYINEILDPIYIQRAYL